MNTSQSYSINPASRLQQQPCRVMDRQQQQSSGSGEFQPRQPAPRRPDGQMGSSWGGQQGAFSNGQLKRSNGF